MPKARAREYLTRAQDDLQYQIDIGVFRHCSGNETDRDVIVDKMVALIEEIELYWAKREIILGADSLMVIASDAAPIYDPDMLKDKGVFGSVLTLTIQEAL